MSDINAVLLASVPLSVTLSDTTSDPLGPFAALQLTSGTAGLVKIQIGQSSGTMWMVQGTIYYIGPVSRVWSTGTVGGATIVGFKSFPIAK